jgi:hypothetical protein
VAFRRVGATICLSVWDRLLSGDDAGAATETNAAQWTQGCQEARGGLTCVAVDALRYAMRNDVDKPTGHDTLRAFLGAVHDAVLRSVAVSTARRQHIEGALKDLVGI